MSKLKVIILIAVAVLVLISPCVNAGGGVLGQKRLLCGIKQIAVSVDMSNEAKKSGVSEDTIMTDIELKLRMAGIKVINVKELKSTKTTETAGLSLTINLFKVNVAAELAFLAVHMNLDLMDNVMFD